MQFCAIAIWEKFAVQPITFQCKAFACNKLHCNVFLVAKECEACDVVLRKVLSTRHLHNEQKLWWVPFQVLDCQVHRKKSVLKSQIGASQSSETLHEKPIEKAFKFCNSFEQQTVQDIAMKCIERGRQGTEEHGRLIEKTYKVIVFGTRQYSSGDMKGLLRRQGLKHWEAARCQLRVTCKISPPSWSTCARLHIKKYI